MNAYMPALRTHAFTALNVLRMQMQHKRVSRSAKGLESNHSDEVPWDVRMCGPVFLHAIVFYHVNVKLFVCGHASCLCLWIALSVIAEQLTTVRLSAFSTIRTEWLLEYLALLLPSSKPFDVCSQQLCINGLGANQKPTRPPYTLAQNCKTLDSLIWVHDHFVISGW